MPVLSDPRFKEQDLQNELDSMTPRELELLQRDKLGTNHPITETPEMLHDALEQLDEELQNIPEKEAYELAEIMCPDYVRSPDFRLMFLRATCFDAKLAAEKLVKYWVRKVALFGPDRAFRKLTIRDLDEEDQVALNKGGVRALPRDEAGRGVFFSCRSLWDTRRSSSNSMVRLSWLAIHTIIEDVEAQKNGQVAVSINTIPTHQIASMENKFCRIVWRDVKEVLPVRMVYVHFFMGSDIIRTLLKEIVLYIVGTREMRARASFHHGTVENFFQTLEEFGINPENLPSPCTLEEGVNDFDYQAWLEEQRRIQDIDED
eukprot:CAMPEP_0195286186 /NCGR_PEP_ID=MMETSP0707-20130614/3733_1 /TAXON_ID=33640 /ORGANISM="Asterionellopsis glacialis, Strain CCMP134" /LENGTH=316 /DNA_ID=CAMNT_0040345787 /DNA_START=373 /DNA_END=1323 /DNA_ORIENTATION=-